MDYASTENKQADVCAAAEPSLHAHGTLEYQCEFQNYSFSSYLDPWKLVPEVPATHMGDPGKVLGSSLACLRSGCSEDRWGEPEVKDLNLSVWVCLSVHFFQIYKEILDKITIHFPMGT